MKLLFKKSATSVLSGRAKKIAPSLVAFEIAAMAARRGDPEAQHELGTMYLRGKYVPSSPNEACLWLGRAACGGHVASMTKLAKLALLGHVTGSGLFLESSGPRYDIAHKWARVASNRGSNEAKSLLAYIMTAERAESQCHSEQIISLLTEASSNGDPSACLQLALILGRSRSDSVDSERIVGLLRFSAQRKMPLALYLLGVASEVGFGTAQKVAAAVDFYEESAKLGLHFAQVRFGCAAIIGEYRPKNFTAAETWFRRAAVQGSTIARILIGNLYAGVDGLSANFSESARWFNQAARTGSEFASNVIALFVHLRLCEPAAPFQDDRDLEVARETGPGVKRARYSEDPAAMFSHGRVELPLTVDARHWFEPAARSGDALAAYRLAECGRFGLTEPLDVQIDGGLGGSSAQPIFGCSRTS